MPKAATGRPVRVLYIVYWGALEPLGRALVLPSVTRLGALGARVTLVTFDKPADLERTDDVERIGGSFREAGVRWVPLRYHKRPKVPATAFDFGHGIARGILERIRERPDVVHGRTFIGGLTAQAVARLTGAKLIYHNEGFYPDEQVDGGVWTEGSSSHRVARRLEQRLYTRSDAVFSLSVAGKKIIESIDGVREKGTPVIVVPSAVDLERFSMPERTAAYGKSPLRLVYVGSVGGRYLLDRIGRFANVARQERPETHLQLLSHADPKLVREMLSSSGLPDDAWSLTFVPHERLAEELAREDAGLFFLRRGIGSAGFSATKIGEYWATGMPVISTTGMADVDEIIRREQVGVVVSGHTDESYRESFAALLRLLQDPDLAKRCRAAAERHYGLEDACKRQMDIYEKLARDGHRRV